MPPKSTTATWPPSRTRTTARKSAPPASSIKIAPPPPPINNSPTLNLKTTTTTTPTPPILGVKNTLSTDSSSLSLSKCTTSTDKPIHTQQHSNIEIQQPIEANIEKQQPIDTQQDANIEKQQPIDKVLNEASTGKGTRKVIRRTVKVVKRVIKRRVPKNPHLLALADNSNVVVNHDNLVAEVVIDKPNVVVSCVHDTVNDTVYDAKGFHDNELVVGDDQVDMMGVDTSFPDKEVKFATETTLESETEEKPSPVEEDVVVKPNLVTENLSIGKEEEDWQDAVDKSFWEGNYEPLLACYGSPEFDEHGDHEMDKNDVNMSVPDSVEEEKIVVLAEEEKDGDGSLRKQLEPDGNCSVECNEGGLLLSDELEALERKKRRKTEIFVGGLEKDVKEDDIRKAFQEAGTVVGVDLVMNTRKTGKNKGFAFVRFSNAAEANTALTKYFSVKICGKQCHVQPVQGNDTIYLGNIERNWKTEDVMKFLEKAGVDKMIDKVIVKADPRNVERNRGFAFLEFETNRTAQNAFYKLQNRNVFGKNAKVRVAWAEPLAEPAEEEILKVKAVYAECIPSSWDEEKVKDYFKRFGEIDSVAHSKDLTSSRRNDFAFINYKTREAALACIEAIRKERLAEDEGSKVKMTVSLAKPISMRKQLKNDTSASRKQLSKDTPKVSTGYVLPAHVKLHEPRNSEKYASSSYNHGRGNTTDELMHLLRRQASTNHIPPRGITGPFVPENHIPLHGDKRPFPFAGHDPLYMESRGIPRARFEYSNPVPGPSYLLHGREMEPFPYYHQQPGHGLTTESVHGRNVYPRHYPTRGREQSPPPYHGNSNIYRRY